MRFSTTRLIKPPSKTRIQLKIFICTIRFKTGVLHKEKIRGLRRSQYPEMSTPSPLSGTLSF